MQPVDTLFSVCFGLGLGFHLCLKHYRDGVPDVFAVLLNHRNFIREKFVQIVRFALARLLLVYDNIRRISNFFIL